MVILKNIDIDIDKAILQNIDIDKISNRFKFGISNRATVGGCLVEKKIGMAAGEKREEMNDKEKERNKGKPSGHVHSMAV